MITSSTFLISNILILFPIHFLVFEVLLILSENNVIFLSLSINKQLLKMGVWSRSWALMFSVQHTFSGCAINRASALFFFRDLIILSIFVFDVMPENLISCFLTSDLLFLFLFHNWSIKFLVSINSISWEKEILEVRVN